MNSKIYTCKVCLNNAMTDRDTCFNYDRALSTMINATRLRAMGQGINEPERHRSSDRSLVQRYPQYYKSVGQFKEVDVYAVCQLFPVDDPSGAINHARKKLLIPGVRTGGKGMRKDIQEAVDTLNRWLQLNPEHPSAEAK